MKKLIVLPLLLFLLFMGAIMAAAPDHSVLESPSVLKQYKEQPKEIKELSSLLKEKRFRSFYNKAKEYKLNFEETTIDNVDSELHHKIWFCYLVAKAPLFTWKTYEETEPEVEWERNTVDISLKFSVCSDIEKYIRLVNLSKKIKEPQKKAINRLLLSYYTRIFNQFKNGTEKKPEQEKAKKEEKTGKERKIIYIESEEQVREIRESIRKGAERSGFISSRDDSLDGRIGLMEKQFMKILVSLFPGNYPAIEAYILKAGYMKKEITNLLDRAVERNKETEFLFYLEHRLRRQGLLGENEIRC